MRYRVYVYDPAARLWRLDQSFANRSDAADEAEWHKWHGKKVRVMPTGRK